MAFLEHVKFTILMLVIGISERHVASRNPFVDLTAGKSYIFALYIFLLSIPYLLTVWEKMWIFFFFFFFFIFTFRSNFCILGITFSETGGLNFAYR